MLGSTTTISVRGEARQIVPADFAVISTAVQLRDQDKQAALERAGEAQSAVLAALRENGGVPLTVESVDSALTWSTTSFSAVRVRVMDRRKRAQVRSWRVHVPITVTVRDLTRLERIRQALTDIKPVRVHHVAWSVDPRNPAWPVVRSAAIADAVAKARDYATALGGSVGAIVHVADAGLLGGHDGFGVHEGIAYPVAGRAQSGSRGPSLDPMPQQISAVVEARFEARIAELWSTAPQSAS